jgi:predicted Rossmann fold nucleotide-binding protein DprA/Smf involved in DNA uptake
MFTKIAIVGGRDFTDYSYMQDSYISIVTEEGFDTKNIIIVSGGCRGADKLAERLADEHCLEKDVKEVTREDWAKHGKSAGPKRNTRIVAACDCVIAFWNGKIANSGTFDTISKAVAAKKPVFIFPF